MSVVNLSNHRKDIQRIAHFLVVGGGIWAVGFAGFMLGMATGIIGMVLGGLILVWGYGEFERLENKRFPCRGCNHGIMKHEDYISTKGYCRKKGCNCQGFEG